MRREPKANLIFLLILIPLLVPGFVILMNKKLSGTTEPNYMPEALPSSSAYIQPPPVPPSVPRVEPPRVRQWVGDLLRERAGAEAILARGPKGQGPAVGELFRTQLLHITDKSPRTIRVMVWDDLPLTERNPMIRLNAGEGEITASSQNLEKIDVPRDIRRALQSVGYVNPPQHVWLASAEFPVDAGTKIKSIVLGSQGRDGANRDETITIPQEQENAMR
ncbi:MAG TPA: hypothetical protein VGB55_08465 [Tepidisphaeraceae bacterium]|jgi:hypothetical protein